MDKTKTLSEWTSFFNSSACKERLISVYGNYSELLEERIQSYRQLLKTFEAAFGSKKPIFIVRIPARINLMGVHIEHRGGYVNYMTIAKETLMAVSPREDDEVHFVNADLKFRSFSFAISTAFPKSERGDWLKYINSVQVERGKWDNYIKASCFYLQNLDKKLLKGMDVAVTGNVPMAAGLSSSSTLVVGTTEALNYINQLNLSKDVKTTMNGEAEWYVGTRGGAGDHAAMIYGKQNFITHLQFFPIRVEMIPLPSEITVVACNSMISAEKSAGAKDIFNERVATYEVAFMLLSRNYPHFKNVHHLRDWNTKNLNIDLAELYKILKSLPISLTREQIMEQLPEHRRKLNTLFSTHREPKNGYQIRAVCLFGLSECARSDIVTQLMHAGDVAEFGRLMYVSHDGDRVTIHDENLKTHPFQKDFSNKYFDQLIVGAKKGLRTAELVCQSGGYNCSTEEMDLLADIARSQEGVYGASLTGGGLGGIVLVLVKKSCVANLLESLEQKYYRPKGLPLGAEECISVEGVSTL
ncbi:MAG: galactokinase family protein [bacterium]